MVDFDLEDKMKDGLKFKEIFKSLFIYSSSLFIAFYWKDLLSEFLTSVMPAGHNILEKTELGALITVMLVIVSFAIFRHGTHEEKKRRR